MRKLLALLFLSTSVAFGQDQAVTPVSANVSGGKETTPVSAVKTKALKPSAIPWDKWFEKNALVTDKSEYVHFFWNAQDFKANFEVKDKKTMLAEAAVELVKRLYPSDAKSDLMKIDIVYVLERDSYGLPKWDSLQRVSHLEFLKSKALKLYPKKGGLTETALKKIFNKFEVF